MSTKYSPRNTKQKLLDKVLKYKKEIEKNSQKDICHSAAYYHSLFRLIDEFIEKVEKTILPEPLGEGWEYNPGFSYEGVGLYLEHIEVLEDRDGIEPPLYYSDQEFLLFTVPAKYLSVEDYAQQYGVNAGTVRQWIRRAKIRTCKKYGNEWRISELTETPKRGYTGAGYYWTEPLLYLPDEFSYLKGFNSIMINQSDNKQEFRITLLAENNPMMNRSFILNTSEREKLELYLIGNPEIDIILTNDESVISAIRNYDNAMRTGNDIQ